MTEESKKTTNEENLVVEEKRETLTLPKNDDVKKEETLENYKKGMFKYKDENKELKEKVAEFERQQKEANEKKLAEEGKYKELLEAKAKELAELNSNIEKERATRKEDNLVNKIKLKAQEKGAFNPDAITKFLDVKGLIDSDDESVDKAINQLMEKESYLFGNKKKSAADENNSVFSGSEKPKEASFLGF
jgi:hypothetical protein